MHGQPGHNTQPHVQLPPSVQSMDAWMISQLNVALIHNEFELYEFQIRRD